MLVLLATAAILSVPQAGPSPKPTDVPELIARIKAAHDSSSWAAVQKLSQVGSPAVPALVEILRDRTLPHVGGVNQPGRSQAALALDFMGAAGEDAVPALLEVVRDRSEDEGLRGRCAQALGSIGRQPDEVVPALVTTLEERGPINSGLDWDVVAGLARMAQQPGARPALIRVRPALERAHERMGGSGAYAALFRVLDPPSPERLADEEDVREAVILHVLTQALGIWCIDQGVSDAVFDRLAGLRVTRDMRECSLPAPYDYSSLDVEAIDWLSSDRVHTTATSCHGYSPCAQTDYELERRPGGWSVVKVEHRINL